MGKKDIKGPIGKNWKLSSCTTEIKYNIFISAFPVVNFDWIFINELVKKEQLCERQLNFSQNSYLEGVISGRLHVTSAYAKVS